MIKKDKKKIKENGFYKPLKAFFVLLGVYIAAMSLKLPENIFATITGEIATNTNKTAKLPYAGTNSSVVVVVIALAASAIYAYKKVSDYNI